MPVSEEPSSTYLKQFLHEVELHTPKPQADGKAPQNPPANLNKKCHCTRNALPRSNVRWRYDEVTHLWARSSISLPEKHTSVSFRILNGYFKRISPLKLQETIRGISGHYLQHFLQHETLLFCTMNSDGATSNFIAIQYKVIVLATDLNKDISKHPSKAGA